MIGRLLYVSDDPRTHRAISPALESVFSVVSFTSDAIRELCETEFASIVIDVDRCSSNVVDLARSIRGRFEGVPIHVIVGKDWDDQLVRELGKLEQLDFIIEPALPEILSQRVADHQRLRHLEQLVAGMLREKQQIGLDFADLNRNLKEAHRSNDELLGTLGHELRNPLTAMTLAVRFLRERPSADPIAQRAAETMDRQVARLDKVVSDLLHLSNLRSGDDRVDRRLVDLKNVLEQARIRAGGKKIHLVLGEEPVPILADVDRLVARLGGLMASAAGRTDQIDVSYRIENGRVVVRVDRVIHDCLDLTVLDRLVELHGGRTRIDGGAFEMMLPLAPSSAPELAHDQKRQRRVAIIEDNADARDLLSEIIAAQGHQVLVAADGRSGLELLRAAQPDVALVDIGLPGIDGYEVAKEIRTDGKPIRLIALTGLGRETDRARALEAGFDFHVTKPPKLAALMRLVEAS